MDTSIGARVRDVMLEKFPDRPQHEVASDVGMTPDGFSRALNGRRAFSSLELAKVADVMDADIHWLITGTPDLQKVILAARHEYNPFTGARSNPGRDGDEGTLSNVEMAYRQAYGSADSVPAAIPRDPHDLRGTLGQDFVRPFIDRLETHLGVDVVRIPGISTAYSFTVVGRNVIVIPTTGSWFWENWSIAHELAHLALGHHVNGETRPEIEQRERAANAFAAELLLPAEELRAVGWGSMQAPALADFVWKHGVSTEALGNRIAALRLGEVPVIREWGPQRTQTLLRRQWKDARGEPDPITERMEKAAARRFPVGLVEAHVKLVEAGDLGPAVLAWMLGVQPESLDIGTPPPPRQPAADDLAEALGL